MRAALGLLALTLVGADGPSVTGPQQITYQIRVVEVDSLDWRGEVFDKLQAVTRQGSATVWTAPKETAVQVVKWAEGRKGTNVLSCPTVTAFDGGTAHISTKTGMHFVGDLRRAADGPVNHAKTVAYVPKVEQTREGLAATLSGRKIDQGVLTRLVLEDSHCTSVHTFKVRERAETAGREPIAATIQVPEIATCEVAGEWVIPNDGVLIVSLGATTVKEKDGKAGVRERVAMVEARHVETPFAAPAHATTRRVMPTPSAGAFAMTGVSRAGFVGFPVQPGMAFAPALAMPAPAVPSRSLPMGVTQHGEVVGLPPLPVDLAPPTAMPGSAEPCATPQTRGHHAVVGEPIPESPSRRTAVDVDSTRAVFEIDRREDCCDDGDCCEGDEACCLKARDAKDAGPGGKGVAFKFPLNGLITIEVRAVAKGGPATPTPSPSSNVKTTPSR